MLLQKQCWILFPLSSFSPDVACLTDEIPSPWQLTDTGSAFKITDARGRGVAFVYYARTDALKADYLTRDQAMKGGAGHCPVVS